MSIESNDTWHYPPDGLVQVPLSGGAVPEPGTFAVWSVLGACGVGIGWYRRRKAS